MGMMLGLRRKVHVRYWRCRYWLLDTEVGRQTHLSLVVLAVMLATAELARTLLEAGPATGQPVKAIAPFVIQLIIAAIAAVVSYALRPKPKPPTPQKAEAPTTEDGQSVKHHFGTCWVSDQFILAWKPTGTTKIKAKSGKKWTPGLLPGTTNPIEAWLDSKWNLTGFADVKDPLGGGWADEAPSSWAGFPDDGGLGDD